MRNLARTENDAISTTRSDGAIRVWDPWVRILHWALAFSVAIAWFSAQRWEGLHDWAGYSAGALVLLRFVWGFIGSRYARFSQFVRSPRAVFRYLGSIVSGGEARFVGHNPAGAAMIVVLLTGMAMAVVTGWLLTTDSFWGVIWVQWLHSAVAHGLLLLIFLHLGGVVLASVRHRENLVRAMLFGDKRAPGPNDVA
jgi:cytochrome b